MAKREAAPTQWQIIEGALGLFGYIKPWEPQLRVCELEAYKAVYCGLCRQLEKSFGLLARFTLSYDITFLAVLAMAVEEAEPDITPGRCPFNPLKKAPMCRENHSLAFSADVAALILYWKLRDNLADGDFWGRAGARLGLLLVKKPFRQAAARQPELAVAFQTMMKDQRELEEARCPNVDQAAQPTALALGEVFAALTQNQGQRRVLGRLGYLMGRYIYLADALDDLEGDRESGGYNPFLLSQEAGETPEELKSRGLGSLYLTIGEAGKTQALLETHRFEPILENILFLGLRGTADRLAQKTGTLHKEMKQ